eukprot:98924_1
MLQYSIVSSIMSCAPYQSDGSDQSFASNQENENGFCDIENCVELKRLISNLTMDNSVAQIDINEVLNDYLHFMDEHTIDEEFQYILTYLNPCNITKCKVFARHYRFRCVTDDDEKSNDVDFNETVNAEILSKIHCYFYHSYDVGHRLTPQEKHKISDYDAEDKNDDPFSEQLTNKRVKAMNVLLCENRKHYEKIYTELNMNKRITDKFNQLHKPTQNNKDAKIYSFGYRFEYEEYDSKDDDPMFQNNTYVTAKYANLKEEITTNCIATLTIHQYNNEYTKAQIHFNSIHNKTKFKDIGIHIESTHDLFMPLECILTLMIYCNYDVLQYEFSKTYREENGKTHSNFYFLGKYMKHAVSRYAPSTSAQYTNSTKIKRFYHGITDKMIFPAYISVLIHSPVSTSSSLEVAINFTNNNQGLVIEFGLLGSRGLDVSWLSDYANEHEFLFSQTEYNEDMSIEDILDPTSGCQYGMVLESLRIIHQIVSREGDVLNSNSEDNVARLSSLTTGIMGHQLSLVPYTASEYTPMKSLSVYGQEICNVYFQNQTEICLSASLRNYPHLRFILNLLFHSNCEWIDLKLISTLFPNVKKISVSDINLTPEIMDTILVYLNTKRKWNISRPYMVEIRAKLQDVMIPNHLVSCDVVSLVDKYSDSFQQCGGFLFYYIFDQDPYLNSLHLQLCDEVEFVVKWIVMNLGRDRVYYKDTNNTITNLMDNLIKMKLSKTVVDDAQLKLFNDYCAATGYVFMDWKHLCSSVKQYFFGIFCDAKNQWIKIEIVNQLFPNLEVLRVSKTNLTLLILQNIVNHLQEGGTKLKSIVLGPAKDSVISTTCAVKHFQKQFNDLGFEIYDEEVPYDAIDNLGMGVIEYSTIDDDFQPEDELIVKRILYIKRNV